MSDQESNAENFSFNQGNRFKTESDWDYFEAQFKDIETSQLENYLLLSEMNESAKVYLKSLEKTSKKEYCVQLMSLPEYQMC